MPTREIPKQDWLRFLDSLSRQMQTQPVTVRVSDPELGYQVDMAQLPLVGVSADMRAAGGPRIDVIVGRTESLHTTHAVINPSAVRVEDDEQGTPTVLEIEGEDGSKTIVLLRPAMMGEPGGMEKAA